MKGREPVPQVSDIGRNSREILLKKVGHPPHGGEAVALTDRRQAAVGDLLGDIGEGGARGQREGVDQGCGGERCVHLLLSVSGAVGRGSRGLGRTGEDRG